MLCDRCKTNEASVHIRKIQNNGEVQALNLCPPCAFLEFMENAKMLSGMAGEPANGMKLPEHLDEEILSKLIDGLPFPLPGLGEMRQKLSKSCKTCGVTLGQIQENGRIGCLDCLTEFRDDIKEMLPPLCLADVDVNWNTPAELNQMAHLKDELDELKQQLDSAVKHEFYERAADIQKTIRMKSIRLLELEQEAASAHSSEKTSVRAGVPEVSSSAPSKTGVSKKSSNRFANVKAPVWCSMTGTTRKPQVRLSSCLMMRRNIDKRPLPPFGEKNIQIGEDIRNYLKGVLMRDPLFGNSAEYDLEKLKQSEKNFLVSNSWCSREYVEEKHPRTLLAAAGRHDFLMINGHDHLSVCMWGKVGGLNELYSQMIDLDSRLAVQMPYLRDPDFGIVSREIIMMGSGIIPCEVLHLPALQMFADMEALRRGFEQLGMRITPFYYRRDKDGTPKYTEIIGNGAVYIVEPIFPSAAPMGRQIQSLEQACALLEHYELEKREVISHSRELRLTMCDMVGRALGKARGAFMIYADSARELLSSLWFGVEMGMLPKIKLADIKQAFAQLVDVKFNDREKDNPVLKARLAVLHAAMLQRLAGADSGNQDVIAKFIFH